MTCDAPHNINVNDDAITNIRILITICVPNEYIDDTIRFINLSYLSSNDIRIECCT